jgi:hypothetical protein
MIACLPRVSVQVLCDRRQRVHAQRRHPTRVTVRAAPSGPVSAAVLSAVHRPDREGDAVQRVQLVRACERHEWRCHVHVGLLPWRMCVKWRLRVAYTTALECVRAGVISSVRRQHAAGGDDVRSELVVRGVGLLGLREETRECARARVCVDAAHARRTARTAPTSDKASRSA